ncbi:hypothetical protein SLW70_12425 [Flavobacterium sp. NG2]|uniref:hypothetical protein n=1 Tax=Flavobacterium sp. NG2 TaxID=3097547 RepID=UPI002A82B1F9|nr:hypothetical protein [Flavobacterium sp. NG2]WPR70732.1 hypothetical protein SLW70_12425 [Flavobacterium sp. NG2]
MLQDLCVNMANLFNNNRTNVKKRTYFFIAINQCIPLKEDKPYPINARTLQTTSGSAQSV